MNLLSKIKGIVERLPESVGRPLSRVPFSFRFGPSYAIYRNKAKVADTKSATLLEQELVQKLNIFLSKVIKREGFYRSFYQKIGYQFKPIKSFKDWEKVPIVTKADLQSFPLEERSYPRSGRIKINTGGTSGQPLEFYLDRKAFSREWAHMHTIWKARGYSPNHLKLTFRGNHFDSGNAVRYNAIHNEYTVNASASMEQVIDEVLALNESAVIRWLHGYPSLIAEFAHSLKSIAPEKLARIRGKLFGVLLGSEYPATVYRSVIENVLSTNLVTWYGHSEMAVLAKEIAHGVYQSLPTYGYAEAVPTEDGKAYRLVCTSLHNETHPFIRYDTGDLIEPISRVGGSLTFKITEGRIGDFVEDRHGKRHSLTAIIFGRHHKAFNQLKHLQVRENKPGFVTLVVTPKDPSIDRDTLWQGFNLDDLSIDWSLEVVSEPVRTAAGKVRLKI